MDSKETLEEPKKTNWWLPICIVILLVVLVGGLAWWQKTKAPKAKVKIGLIIPLTGKAAYWGDPVNKGVKLALDKLNLDSKNQVELIIEDSQSDPKTAVTAAHKLIDVDKVDAIYSENSGPSSSVSPIALASQKVFVFSAFQPDIIASNSLAIKTLMNYEDICSSYAAYAQNQGIKKISIIGESNGVAPTCARGLEKYYAKENVLVDDLTAQDDMKSVITKLKGQNPDVLIPIGYEASSLTIAKEIKELNWSVPFFCYKQNCATQKIVDEVGLNNSDKTIYFEAKVSKDFQDKYFKTYNTNDEGNLQPSSFAYDAILMMYNAIDKCRGKDNNCILSNITESKLSNSAVTSYKFNGRILVPELSYYKVVNGSLSNFNME